MPAEADFPPQSGSMEQAGYDQKMGGYQEHPEGSGKRRRVGATRDCFDLMLTYVNYDLLVVKIFYFFFFAAFGSLFPLLAIYFKQLGMNPAQTGILIGFRPFIEFVSAPLWGGFADKWKKGKQLLLFSLFCWVAFTLALAFIQPPPKYCIVRNDTDIVLVESWHDRNKRSALPGDLQSVNEARPHYYIEPVYFETSHHILNRHKRGDRYSKEDASNIYRTKMERPPVLGMSPLPIDLDKFANGYKIKDEDLVSPLFTNIVYRSKEVQEVFLLLLLLVIIGEFFAAPAITLADSATLGYLGDDMENYGRQRMFGSFGWGLAMFFVGIALDHSHIFPDHPCGETQVGERNYTVCFAVFSVLMSCAFIGATQFKFFYDGQRNEIQLTMFKEKVVDKLTEKISKKKKVPTATLR